MAQFQEVAQVLDVPLLEFYLLAQALDLVIALV